MKAFPSLPLAERLAAGLAHLTLALKTATWRVAQPLGLSATQVQTLTLLLASPRGLTLNELACCLGVRPPTASEVVAGLSRRKLISRRVHPADARSVVIELTPHGRKLALRLPQRPAFLRPAIEQLSEHEQSVLLGALVKISRYLHQQGEVPLARACVNCLYLRADAWRNAQRPHHCDFVNAPFSETDFMLDCPHFQPASVPPPTRGEPFDGPHHPASLGSFRAARE